MKATHFVGSFYALLHLLSNVYASQLLFRTSETVIHPILTKVLRLRCSVINDANPMPVLRSPLAHQTLETSAGLQARQLYSENMTSVNNDLFKLINEPRNDSSPHPLVTSPPYDISPQADIAHVMSMIVNKEIYGKSVTVAKVTPYDPASASTWLDSAVQVKGNCETSPLAGEQAYLELTWVSPKEEQAGQYTCEMYALNSDSLPVSLSTSLTILSSEPSFDDLVSYVVDHDKIIADKEKEIELLKNESSLLQNELQELRADVASEMKDLRVKMDIMASPNIESGYVTCPFNAFIHFKQEYLLEPLVFTTLINVTCNGNYNSQQSFGVNLSNVNTTGFNLNLVCGNSYCASFYKWIALGHYG